MPSPFPGMGPFLEGELWTNFHTQFAVEIARILSPQIRPRYVALTQKRFVTDSPDEAAVLVTSLYPDVGVASAGSAGPAPRTGAIASPLETISLLPGEVPHVWVEIRDTENRELISCIEFPSPTNKRGQGREEYLKKRASLPRSRVNLLEIDLLHQGQRVPVKGPLLPLPYFIFLSRGNRRPVTEYWPIALDQPLPRIPVPLRESEGDVSLDLQVAFTNVYDGFGYDLLIDYREGPEPALPRELSTWTEDILRERGMRPGEGKG